MELPKARALANALLIRYGLYEQGWRFNFDNAVQRFGCCKTARRQITLSKKMTYANDEARVQETLLHEIAHALTPDDIGHGREWRRKCIELGIQPRRCYSEANTVTLPSKYVATCEVCGYEHGRHRLPRQGSNRVCVRTWQCKQERPRLVWRVR